MAWGTGRAEVTRTAGVWCRSEGVVRWEPGHRGPGQPWDLRTSSADNGETSRALSRVIMSNLQLGKIPDPSEEN